MGVQDYIHAASLRVLESGGYPCILRPVSEHQQDIMQPVLGSFPWYQGTFDDWKLFQFLASSGSLYTEIPAQVWRVGNYVSGYSKALITTSPSTACAWVNSDTQFDKFSTHVEGTSGSETKILKLDVERSGTRKVVKARKPLDFADESLRVLPWNSIVAVWDFLNSRRGQYFMVTYYTDAGTLRKLPFQVPETGFDDSWWDNTYRGYFRVVDLESSTYDRNTKSVNLLRIDSIVEISPDDIDTRYQNIYVEGVLSYLEYEFSQHISTDLQYMLDSLHEAGVTSQRYPDYTSVVHGMQFEYQVGGTTYLRRVVDWVLDHPEWFNYTKAPKFAQEGYTMTPNIINF